MHAMQPRKFGPASATLIATEHVKNYLKMSLNVEEFPDKYFRDHDICYMFTNGENFI